MKFTVSFFFLATLASVLALPFQHKIYRARLGREDRPLGWWENGLVYQVYPRSFQDSNNDGVGDLKGITSRLNYFIELGVNMIWISPFFKSPMADFGYDISNFTDVDPIFGTMEDFRQLTAEAESKNIKVILDMVPNHSSDEHEWFIKSVNREDPYTDYYVWRRGTLLPNGTEGPPNNWLSVFAGSAWTYNSIRGEWYLHQFATKQPDLNYRNPLIHEEWKKIIRFWLEQGAHGFRVDAVPHIYEDPQFLDEPLSGDPNARPDEYGYLNHIYTWNLPEHYGVIAEMRQVLQEFEEADGQHRILLTEAYVPLDSLVNYYGNETNRLADFPFNFALIKQISDGFTGTQLYNTIVEYLDAIPDWAWPNWVLGNHDNNRTASRIGVQLVDAIVMVQLLLPGTPVTYYGEELGMDNTFISWEDTQDPQGCNTDPDRYQIFSRDPARTPMQWDASQNAGFSQAEKTWLPMNPNYTFVNVQIQKETLESHLNVYRALVSLRKESAILYGNTTFHIISDSIFSFSRIYTGKQGYLIIINVGNADENVDFSAEPQIPAEAQIIIHSVGSRNRKGTKVATNAIPIAAREGLVLSFVPLL